MAEPMLPSLLQVLFLFSLLQSMLILHVDQGSTLKVSNSFPPLFFSLMAEAKIKSSISFYFVSLLD